MEPSQKKEVEKKRCLVCQEEILFGSRKCIHCDSFQDWRRKINLGNSVLSLMVALISVIGLTFPAIMNSLKKDGSSVEVTLLKIPDEIRGDGLGDVYPSLNAEKHEMKYVIDLDFLATNSGNRPGRIGEGMLSITHKNVVIAKGEVVFIDETKIVKSGDYTILESIVDLEVFDRDVFPKKIQFSDPDSSEMELDWSVFNKEIEVDLNIQLNYYEFNGVEKNVGIRKGHNLKITYNSE